MMVKAIVNEIKRSSPIQCFVRRGAEITNKYVGESERHLRVLFEEARRASPSLIVFDEIDAIAPTRSMRQVLIHSSF